MPGNGVDDRAHNFFAHEDLSSGHRYSQAADGSWQELGNHPWAGSQSHIGLPSSNSKGYSLQQSDIERGQNSQFYPVAHGLNNGQPSLGPEHAKSHSQSQLPAPNGYINGHQILQTRQNDANFLDSESGRYTMVSRGLSVYESLGGNDFQNNVGSVGAESSESRIGFDFLGGQQQINMEKIGVLQSLPQQLSGFNNMQLLQQQAMLRKMQELQRQRPEARQHNLQTPSIINGTLISPITPASNITWPTEPSAGNKSWPHRATQAVQGSPNEFRFPPEQGQTLSLMDLIPQQVDQSLYGVPVSNTRGTPNHYSHISRDKNPLQQMAVYNYSSPGHEYTGHTGKVNVQNWSLSSRQGFKEENLFGRPSDQGLPRDMYLGNPQIENSLQMEVPVRELAGPSETLEGKEVLPVSSPQNTVALDPAEEKILFGDDNIWDSFGNSPNVGAVGGSWSALMQSAVAETSGCDIGLQEEWSGSSIQNTEAALAPHPSDANINNQGIPGFPQSVAKHPYEHSDRLQMVSTQRSFHHSMEEGSKWLSRGPLQKPPAEGTHVYQNAPHSSDAAVNAKSMPGPWVPQKDVSSHNSGQRYGELNDRDNVETPSSSRNELSRFYGNESQLQRSGSANEKKMIHGEMYQGVYTWETIPGSQSTLGSEQARIGMGSPQVNREDAILKKHLGMPHSSIAQVSEGTTANTNNLNFWNHSESLKMNKGNEPKLNRGSFVLESSIMSNSSNDLVSMQEAEKSERKENSTDSHNSNISPHTTAGSSDNNIWFGGSDTRNLIEGKQKLPGQCGHKVSGPRKFQYHPMGNLDENVKSSLGRKYATNNHSHGYLGKSKIGRFPKTSSEMEKGHMFSVQQNKMRADDSPSSGTLAGFAPNTSAPFESGNFGIHASDKAPQSSQNVIKFLHDIDQSKENSNYEGSHGALKQSRSPSSHGFGLQLGFSSQLSAQNHLLSSHSSAQLAGCLSSIQSTPDKREKDNPPLTSAAQTGSFPSLREISEGEVRNDRPDPQYNMLGKLNSTSNSGLPFFRGQLQGQQMLGAADRPDPHSLQMMINQKDGPLSSRGTSQPTDAIDSHERAAAKEISMRRAPTAWTNTPSQQNIMGGQPHNKFPPSIYRPCQVNNNVVSTIYSQQVSSSGESQQLKEGLHPQASSADLAPKPSVSEGKESMKNQYRASPSNSSSTERDFEAFGRSLKPNNLSHSTYSLLDQMRAMKGTEIDPCNSGLKQFKEAETSVGSQMRQMQSSEQSAMVGDPNILSFSESADTLGKDSSSQLVNASSDDVLVPGRMDSGNLTCSTSTSSVRVEHSQISLQMAPSWFEQYGTFKNGQMSSMNNAHKYSALKTIEQRFPLGKSSETLRANSLMEQTNAAADSNHAGNIWQRSIPTPVTVESLPSTHLIARYVADEGLPVARQKKRKSTTKLPSWHEEVTRGSQNILTISMADVEWAEEANRLVDKVEGELETVEDGPPNVRSKRRLIFTTRLMQQVFRPPGVATLSADAYSNYEAVACMGARLALGDACSLIACSESDSHEPLDSVNSLTDYHKSESKRPRDQHLSEVTEHFIGRAKKLENEFMRLDKSISVADLRVESQELENFSLINRFASFHGRGQTDPALPGPQRYINALSTPRALPESVQCLSL